VLYRKVARDKPTLLLDEVDPIFGKRLGTDAEGPRALLDAGYRPGILVPRCVGPKVDIRDFEMYCPKALAGIGELPDTLASRSNRCSSRAKAPCVMNSSSVCVRAERYGALDTGPNQRRAGSSTRRRSRNVPPSSRTGRCRVIGRVTC
jgi:hypothetical protein